MIGRSLAFLLSLASPIPLWQCFVPLDFYNCSIQYFLALYPTLSSVMEREFYGANNLYLKLLKSLNFETKFGLWKNANVEGKSIFVRLCCETCENLYLVRIKILLTVQSNFLNLQLFKI